jgi:CubicO group peptidase (beta-lactamase class C family)
MRLWEDGAFQLDDDVNRYLTFAVRNPQFPTTPITFRMLLTHTSSISEIFQQAGRERLSHLYGSKDSEISLGDIVREFLVPGGKYFWDFSYRDAEPGTRYEYCNVGYSLIGHLVERLSGTSFDAFLRKRLLDPIGMPDSTFRLADTKLPRFAYAYRPDGADAPRMVRIAPFTRAGYTDGSLRTTVDDYGRFLAMLLNQGRRGAVEVFKPATIAAWLAPQKIAKMPPARGGIAREDYTLGWPVHRIAGEIAYLHNGSGSGFGTHAFIVPALRTGGMIFVTGPSTPQELFPRLERIIGQMVEAARGL